VNTPGRRRLSWRRKLLFAAVPLLVLLGLGEVAARWLREQRSHSPFMTGSFRDQRIDLMRRGYPSAYHPQLGYVPRPGFVSGENRWGTQVSIDERSLRRNVFGGVAAVAFPPTVRGVLAVGDSFTFGDQVSDHETWPARLEQHLRRPVWNGGVFGYSFAQTVLRAEALLPTLPLDALVVGLIPDDLKRCEMSRRFTEVPWYDVVDGALVLKNVPVPDSDQSELDRQYGRKLLGYSALADLFFWNACPEWWVGAQREVYVHPRGTGLVIATKLLERLMATCRAQGIRVLLVLQDVGKPQDWSIADGQTFLKDAGELGVPCLDLQSEFTALATKDPSLVTKWFAGHMTAAGNAWVAERIASKLGR
jgi:GNAT superfamily N-acetyltransferase